MNSEVTLLAVTVICVVQPVLMFLDFCTNRTNILRKCNKDQQPDTVSPLIVFLFHYRVFTFGIGSGVSTELVRGIARAGNGRAEFVYEGERIQPKVHCCMHTAFLDRTP